MAPKFNQFLLGHRQYILAIDHDAAGGGFDQPIDVAYQGGFARAGQPHDHGDFPGGNVDVNILQSKHVVVLFEQFPLGHALLDFRQHGLRSGTENLVQILYFDLGLSHDEFPRDVFADARHIFVRHDQK